MAKLYFRYGVMSSGKTRDLIKTIYNYKYRNMNILLLKPSCDKKANNYILARDGGKIKVDHLIKKGDNIYKLVEDILNKKIINCILIDESQFLEPCQIDQLSDIVDYLDIPVICYGLRADFQTQLFPGSKRLFELADTFEEMKTICRCGRKATMNIRMNGDIPIFDGKQVAIDGMDASYDSLCRTCYKEEKTHHASKTNLEKNSVC